MFARAAELYVVAPGVSEEESRALTSLSNGLELEWHKTVLAFDCAIKMLEAPLSVPGGFSRCQPLPRRPSLGPASLRRLAGLRGCGAGPAKAAKSSANTRVPGHRWASRSKAAAQAVFRQPEPLPDWLFLRRNDLFQPFGYLYAYKSYACARTADVTAETKQVKYVWS